MPNTDPKTVLDRLLLDDPDVKEGRMFGYAAYYVRGKLFACIYGDGVGVKVPEHEANRLLASGLAVPFQPQGKPKMREWIQLSRARPEDYRKDVDIFRASIAYVRRAADAGGKRK